MKHTALAILTLAAGLGTGCTGSTLPRTINALAKDPARTHVEFTGWNTHFVFERDGSNAVALAHEKLSEPRP
jgi:hypothetical protein